MAEYYAVLSKAVVGLTESAEARRKVYDKARNALIGQLKAIDPPLPTTEISRQRLELEEAIRRVEREAAAAAVSAAPKAPRPHDRPARRSSSDSPEGVSPEQPFSNESASDIFRRAVEEAGSQQPNAGAEPEPPSRAQRHRPPSDAEGYPELDPPRGAPASRASVDRPGPDSGPPASHGYDRPSIPESEPSGGYDYEWERGAETPPPIPDPFSDQRDHPQSGRRRRLPGDEDLLQRPARRSRLSAVLLAVLVLVMLVGLGAFGWSRRDVISDLLAAFDQGGETAPPAQSSSGPAGRSSEPAKVDDRLPGGDAGSDARVVGQRSSTDQPALAPDGGDLNALVAQSATLYEEPLDSSAAETGVLAIDADVTWAFSASGASGPEIVANLHVPDRNLNIRVAISRNTDETLPASHLVVITSEGAIVGIDKVPRLVFKATEGGRGQPLIGATAKVADGLFWIALSANTDDVAFNIDLIRDRSWIDLPLVYDSGQRAILTFEKGTPGTRVVEQALAAWEAD